MKKNDYVQWVGLNPKKRSRLCARLSLCSKIDLRSSVNAHFRMFLDVFNRNIKKLYGRPPQYAPPCKLTFDLLTLKVVSESCVTRATSVPILVFPTFCSRLRPHVRDRQTDVRHTSDAHHRLMPPPYGGGGIKEHCKLTYYSDFQWRGHLAILQVSD